MSLPDTAWRRSLRHASFRGVAFEVDDHRVTGGRRVAVHEYPLNEQTETEDLGRMANRFEINAYVIGPDYISARDRLEAELAKPGPAALVHPYRGDLQVVVLEYSLRESTREGGMAAFQIQLIEHVPARLPTEGRDTQARLGAAAKSATAALEAQFASQITIANDAERDALGATQSELLGKVVSLPSDLLAEASRAERQLRQALLDPVANARAVVRQYVDLPGTLASLVTRTVGRVEGLADLRSLFDAGIAPRRSSGNAAANNTASVSLVQGAAVVAAAGTVAGTEFDSVDDATAIRDELLDQIDRVQASADDGLFDRLQDLRAALAEDVRSRSADLRRLTSYTPAETVPAVVVAQQLYGPAALDANTADIVARNGIAHPLFVAGGQPLEVLSA